jgi:hypothetical protein
MNHVRMYRAILVVLAAAAVLLVACSSNDRQDTATATPGPGTTFLFALQGNATLDGDKLLVTSEHVDWFTDRPERHAGRMTNENFVLAWQAAKFDEVAPNAFLAGDASDIVVVLTEPEATADGLAFTLDTALSGNTGNGSLGKVGLFIDAACGPADIHFPPGTLTPEQQQQLLEAYQAMQGLDCPNANLFK